VAFEKNRKSSRGIHRLNLDTSTVSVHPRDMTSTLADQIDAICEAFDIVGISVSQFLIKILSNKQYSNHATVQDLLSNEHSLGCLQHIPNPQRSGHAIS
jgi:hypothetical protein